MFIKITQKKLGDFYGISQSAVSYIKKRQPKRYKGLLFGYLAEEYGVSLKMFEALVELRERLREERMRK